MKKELFTFSAVLALIISLSAASCKEPVTPVPTTPVDTTDSIPAVTGEITLHTAKSLIFTYKGGAKSISFSCNVPWSATLPDWVTGDVTSGEGGDARARIKLDVESNYDGADRIGEVRIATADTAIVIPVTQNWGVEASSVQDIERFYKAGEFSGMDFCSSASQWFFGRSRQSEHFIVFWEDGYGENDPNSSAVPANMRVDIDNLLLKAELYFDMNINKLGFAELGTGKSYLDDYKMEIYILYQTDWLATGAGYDNVIGALWVNPSTCQPVGSTIAHEIGHSFQYQVYCDKVYTGEVGAWDMNTGYRYEIGQGCGFWEQCAQWQSYQLYAREAFDSYNFTEFRNNCHRHFLHEHQRYASYWLQWYWAEKHGVHLIGDVWRASLKPEDPIQTYMKVTDISLDELNAELYDYAAKCVTWDLDVESEHLSTDATSATTHSIRSWGESYIGAIGWNSTTTSDGFHRVAYDKCLEATGFNHIQLNVPAGGTTISVEFKGLPNAEGYNSVRDASVAGWTYGYVALLSNGNRVYSDPTFTGSELTGNASFTVPEETERLWLVVSATPTTYLSHPWDENNTNDEQWPYEVRFNGTNLYGSFDFDGTETPHDVTIDLNVSFPATTGSDYSGRSISIGGNALLDLVYAFVLQPSEISGKIGSDIKFYGVNNSDGSLYTGSSTANGYGYWFDEAGDVCGWGDSAKVYYEFDETTLTYTVGQYPGHCTSGNTFCIGNALVYGDYQATVRIHVTIE